MLSEIKKAKMEAAAIRKMQSVTNIPNLHEEE